MSNLRYNIIFTGIKIHFMAIFKHISYFIGIFLYKYVTNSLLENE